MLRKNKESLNEFQEQILDIFVKIQKCEYNVFLTVGHKQKVMRLMVLKKCLNYSYQYF